MIKFNFWIILFLYLLTVAQDSLAIYFNILPAPINICLIFLAVIFTLEASGEHDSFYYAFSAGLALDLLSYAPMLTISVYFLLSALIFKFLRKHLEPSPLFALIFPPLFFAGYYIILLNTGNASFLMRSILINGRYIALGAGLNTAVFLGIYLYLVYGFKILEKKQI